MKRQQRESEDHGPNSDITVEREAQRAVQRNAQRPAPGRRTRVQARYGNMVQKKTVQAKPESSGSQASSQSEIAAHGFSGSGGPVPYAAEMEQSFGVSFAGVTAHTNESARTANEAMGSQAYAMGNHVAFATASPSKAVVAHELAHTIQQSDAPVVQHKDGGATASHSSFEAEADAAADAVVSGQQATVTMRTTGSAVQRWGGSDHYMIGNLGGQKALARIKAKNGGVLPDGVTTTTAPQIARPGDTAAGENEIVKGDGETLSMGTVDHGVFSDTRGELSMGGASRIGGDYVKTPEALGEITEEMYESYGSMVAIASTNANHFYPLNHNEYAGKHAQALGLARAAAAAETPARRNELFRQAMIFEGFACHFLQDTFAAGHHAPRALDAMSSYWEWNESARESERGLNRTKDWHDFFCMVPDGLPTSQGRFHGDYYMDGHDLDVVSTRTSESIDEIVSTAYGLASPGAVTLPVPDFSGIMTDPVAGPVWRAMIGAGGPGLDGYGSDMNTVDQGDRDYTTSGGVQVGHDEIVDPMQQNIFGQGQSHAGAAGTKANVVASMRGIQHFLQADFHANVHTHEDDEGNVVGQGSARFDVVDLEKSFHMYSGLLDLVTNWRAGMQDDDPNKAVADHLHQRVQWWIQEASKNVVMRISNGLFKAIVQADIQAAMSRLG